MSNIKISKITKIMCFKEKYFHPFNFICLFTYMLWYIYFFYQKIWSNLACASGGYRNRTEVTRPGRKHPYPLRQLISPVLGLSGQGLARFKVQSGLKPVVPILLQPPWDKNFGCEIPQQVYGVLGAKASTVCFTGQVLFQLNYVPSPTHLGLI